MCLCAHNKVPQLHNFKPVAESWSLPLPLCPCIPVFKHRVCLCVWRTRVFTRQCVCWVGVKKNYNLETGNLQGEHFFFFFFFSKGKSLWSPVCFFLLQTGRRGEAEGFWGHGNKKAAGSCTFHSWLMSQWDDVSYQHSAHGGGRRKVYRG